MASEASVASCRYGWGCLGRLGFKGELDVLMWTGGGSRGR